MKKNLLSFLYLGSSLKWVQLLKRDSFCLDYGHKITIELGVCFEQEIRSNTLL